MLFFNETRQFCTQFENCRNIASWLQFTAISQSKSARIWRGKMVFVAGPRQVGKTTLAKNLPGAGDAYLNWDIDEHRSRILEGNLPDSDL